MPVTSVQKTRLESLKGQDGYSVQTVTKAVEPKKLQRIAAKGVREKGDHQSMQSNCSLGKLHIVRG